jgi:hypothetical protein
MPAPWSRSMQTWCTSAPGEREAGDAAATVRRRAEHGNARNAPDVGVERLRQFPFVLDDGRVADTLEHAAAWTTP